MPEVTAFNWVPDFAQGFVRDLRVRWALEEAGLAYSENIIDHDQKVAPAHLRRQPFAQVPAYRDGPVDMFESGAIVLRIAERSKALMPAGEAARARTASWVFAAMNSVEPFVMNVRSAEIFWAAEPWAKGFGAKAAEILRMRLQRLSDWLGSKDYLEGEFSAGDLMMACVLREIAGSPHLAAFPELEAYCVRCTGRPAFRKALAAQLKHFEAFEAAQAAAT
ncbi:MAG: glutathione S-transferase family protein [Acidobacteria bacterium]|jgi:glutathione S-transferase|nr:glutathione S-transferase family protein [Acidobacteriota bacterium]